VLSLCLSRACLVFVFKYKWHRKNAVFAQGPTTLPVASYTTALPEQVAGATWDGGPSSIGVRLELLHLAGRKTVVFLRHYTLDTEHLPRQARDNDRENSEKDVFSLRAPPRDTADTGQLGRDTGKSRQIAPAFPLGLREKTRERLRCLNQGRRPAPDCNTSQSKSACLCQQLAKYFTQTPRLEVSDEGSLAITSIQDRVISDVVLAPTDEWDTFGPIGGQAPLLNCTRRSIEWFAASIGHAHVGALSAWAIDDGKYKKTPLEPFADQKRSIYQDMLGTNTGETPNEMRLSQAWLPTSSRAT
jgi:hypothetical protein